jgi:RNA 2',3'-cyclic 3'-phosphodiesterase
MARPTANLRLFAAIYPPPELAQAMLAVLKSLQLPAYRATPSEQLHMTVQFIGDTPSAELDATIESVQRAAAGLEPFELRPLKLITLPGRGPARLIAAETESHPTLMEIHRRLVTRLARNVRERDAERFRPHLTLCRFRSPSRGLKVEQQLALPAFTVDRVLLMRGTLHSTGAIHHEVVACELAI